MKRFLKTSVLAVLIAVMLAFAGCGGISQKSADAINEASKNGEPMTVAEVKEKYGDPTVEFMMLGTGSIIYVNGCKTWEDVEAKIEAGEKMAAMVVACVGGNATGAVYYDNYEGQK